MSAGPRSTEVSESLREQVLELSNRYKDEALCAMLGISASTLTRILNGTGRRISFKVLQRIRDKIPADAAPARKVPPAAGENEFLLTVGGAMLAETRGDYFHAETMLAGRAGDGVAGIGAGIVLARIAASQGNLERADYLLADAVAASRQFGAKFLHARAEFEWAVVLGRRQKTNDAVMAFRRAEGILGQFGPDGGPYLMLVRQAFLGYVLHVGYYEDAERLLALSIESGRRAEPAGGLWQIETALLAAIQATVERQAHERGL